jgi:hypothetical protein
VPPTRLVILGGHTFVASSSQRTVGIRISEQRLEFIKFYFYILLLEYPQALFSSILKACQDLGGSPRGKR